jgi:integrase
MWITHNALRLSHGSIRAYLHGIGTMHVMLGHANPVEGADIVWRAYLGVRRVQGGEALQEKRLPITVELLLQLERWQDMHSQDGKLQRAAMWLGTCGLLRSGEFVLRNKDSVLLKRGNLSFHGREDEPLAMTDGNVTHMRVKLDRSKTDQQSAGASIVVAHPTAIQAMRIYLSTRGGARASEPLLMTRDSKPLSYTQLMQRTHALLTAAGVEGVDQYKGHSFRRGGATSLHLAGQPDSIIKAMGRWRSFTFATYVDTALPTLIAAGRAMTGAAATGKSVTFVARQFEEWTAPVWEERPAPSCARSSHN